MGRGHPWVRGNQDGLVVILRPDQQDYQGTAITLKVARRLQVRQMMLVASRLPSVFDTQDVKALAERRYNCFVAGILPHFDEMMVLASPGIFAVRYPDHAVTGTMRQIADAVAAIGTGGGTTDAATPNALVCRHVMIDLTGCDAHELNDASPPSTETEGPSRWAHLLSRLSKRGQFWLAAIPALAVLAVAKALLLTGAGSFSGPIGLVGVLGASSLARAFPMLLLVASRHKGEVVPGVPYRFMGETWLVSGLCALCIGSIFLRGLVI